MRTDIGRFLTALIYIYILLIFAHVVVGWLLNLGLRIPYSRATDAILTFLRDLCEPTLRLVRRVIPPFGPLDLSPMIAILLLVLLNSLLVERLIA